MLFLNISFNFMEISNCRQSGICNYHHFSFSTNFIFGRFPKSFYNNLRFLADIIWMQFFIFFDNLCCSALRKLWIFRCIFCNFETGTVSHIILQNIQNESFFNRLSHAINMKWMETSICPLTAKHL